MRVLCPRIVPRPLWGINLATLVHFNSALIKGILGEGYMQSVEKLATYWFSLGRDMCCTFCGSVASEIDEDWRYYVAKTGDNKVYGIAFLASLRPVCRICHLSKHVGFATSLNLEAIVVEHLAHINHLDLKETIKLLNEAFRIWQELTEITDWKIKVSSNIFSDKSLRTMLEETLNEMLEMQNRGYYLDKHWLWYIACEETSKSLEKRARKEALTFLREVTGYNGRSLVKLYELLKSSDLFPVFVRRLDSMLRESIGAKVLHRELLKAIDLILNFRGKLRLSALFRGKWIFFARRETYGKVFLDIIENLRERGLDYDTQ